MLQNTEHTLIFLRRWICAFPTQGYQLSIHAHSLGVIFVLVDRSKVNSPSDCWLWANATAISLPWNRPVWVAGSEGAQDAEPGSGIRGTWEVTGLWRKEMESLISRRICTFLRLRSPREHGQSQQSELNLEGLHIHSQGPERGPVLMVRTGASIGSQMTPPANKTSLLSGLKSPCCSYTWGRCFLQCTVSTSIQKLSQLPTVPLSLLKVHWGQGHHVCLYKLCPVHKPPAKGACGC